MHFYGMTGQDSLRSSHWGALHCFLTFFFQKTSRLMVLKPPPPPPPPPPPDGPQLPGGLLSSEPLGLNEQEDEGAWRAWVRALSSCSYWQHRGKTSISIQHPLEVIHFGHIENRNANTVQWLVKLHSVSCNRTAPIWLQIQSKKKKICYTLQPFSYQSNYSLLPPSASFYLREFCPVLSFHNNLTLIMC